MNSNDCILRIEIFYEDTKFEISSNSKITLEDIKNKSFDHFKIADNKNYIRFCHKDKEKKMNFLENDDDIIKYSEEIDPDNYILKTQLIIDKYKFKYDLYKKVSKSENEKLKKEIDTYKSENEILKKETDTNKSENEILKKEIDTNKSENEKIKKEKDT